MAQQADPGDVPRHHAADVRLPHHFRESSEEHRGLLTRALPRESYTALGWARDPDAQESSPSVLSALVDPGASSRQWPRNDLRPIRSLQRHLAHFNLPAAFTESAALAPNRAGWRKLVTEPPFELCKPFVRQPRGDTRVTPEDKLRLAEQRAAEIAKRRQRHQQLRR